MNLADEASYAARKGDDDEAKKLHFLALENERAAAQLIATSYDLEPTRSVLFRSAASLAIDCGDFREAEKLVAQALTGNPPEEIAEELRDLLEQVHFRRHLALRGVTLHRAEFQMTLAGSAIGFGIAPSAEFVTRIQDLDRLLYRTAERKLGRAFRDRGRRSTQLAKEVGTYITVPRAASFAVTVHIGLSAQLALPGMDLPQQVIDDTLDCFQAIQDGNLDALHRQIPDVAYRRNFFALAKRLAPDGVDVTSVGFIAGAPGHDERRVLLTRYQTALPLPQAVLPEEKGTPVTVRGTLRFADSRTQSKNEIRLVDTRNAEHRIVVPEGMMDDIVRPLWDYEVEVFGLRRGRVITLEAIGRVEDDDGSQE